MLKLWVVIKTMYIHFINYMRVCLKENIVSIVHFSDESNMTKTYLNELLVMTPVIKISYDQGRGRGQLPTCGSLSYTESN